MTGGPPPLRRLRLAGAIAAAGCGAALGWLGWLGPLERPLGDGLLAVLAPPPRDDIVVVAIDGASLAAHGRWPWPRRLQAELIERIGAAGPRALGIVLLLTEPGEAEGDALLVRAVARAGRVVLPVHAEPAEAAGPPVERLPFPALAGVVAGLGHVASPVDPDGVTRGVRLRAGVAGPVWPAFALCLLAAGDGRPTDCAPAPVEEAASLAWVPGTAELVPPGAGWLGLRTFSATDLLDDRVPAAALADRWVLLGVTAAGLDAPVRTAGGPVPAVVYHARVLAALLDGALVAPVPRWAVALVAALAGLAAALAGRPVRLALVGTAGLLAAAVGLLLGARLWLAPVPAVATLLLVAAGRLFPGLLGLRARLARMRARHALMLEAIGDAVLATDRASRVSFANPAAERLLGVPRERLLGRPAAEVLRLVEPAEEEGSELQAGALTVGEARLARLRREDGAERSVRMVTRSLGPAGERGTMLVLADVTRQAELARELAQMAGRDDLTGLANRRLLVHRLERAVARAGRAGTRLAVLFVDLDRFKTVNDGLGHGVGDVLLVEVARRLEATVRATDTVARLGGDEFVVLLDPLRADADAARVAGAIQAGLGAAYLIEGHELILGVSIGIALYPADAAVATDLLARADVAMYRAKTRGGGGFAFFSPEMHAAALERLELDRGLRRALAGGELVLHYQPTVRLVDGEVVGVEALLRWRHPMRGLVPPAAFVGLAEETGLIVPVGAWAMRTACRQAARWGGAAAPALTVAVNVSARQVHRADLVGLVRDALEESRLPPERLVLELTESTLMDDVEAAARVLGRLKERGIKVALDDFGTGYSSLGYLKRLPIDCLKIDRSFVQRIGASADDEAIVRAIIGLAETLRLAVVAEGVERPEQAVFLARSGCATAQGFLFGRPVPAEELAGRLAG